MFRYFPQPHEFSTYTASSKLCAFCKQQKPGYDGPFYSQVQISFVCEECLISGKLTEVGATTNEGNLGALVDQIRQSHPGLDDVQIRDVVAPKQVELEQRTPRIVTWQGLFWPAHCGDFCSFIKEAGKPDLLRIATRDRMHQIFGAQDDKKFGQFWESIRSDSPSDNTQPYSIGVYLFQCLHCGEYVALWDCD